MDAAAPVSDHRDSLLRSLAQAVVARVSTQRSGASGRRRQSGRVAGGNSVATLDAPTEGRHLQLKSLQDLLLVDGNSMTAASRSVAGNDPYIFDHETAVSESIGTALRPVLTQRLAATAIDTCSIMFVEGYRGNKSTFTGRGLPFAGDWRVFKSHGAADRDTGPRFGSAQRNGRHGLENRSGIWSGTDAAFGGAFEGEKTRYADV